MNKVLVITHTDLDGVSCGVLFKHFISQSQEDDWDVDTIYCGYNTIAKNVKNAVEQMKIDSELKYLFITDISFSQNSGVHELLQEIHESFPDKTIKLIDHHSTALWLNDYEWAEVKQCDPDGTLHCATYWVHKYLMENSPWSPLKQSVESYEIHLNKLKDEWEKVLDTLSIPYLRYTNSNPLEEYVMMVDLWDTWRWKSYFNYYNPDFDLSNDLNSLLHVKGSQEFCIDVLKKLASPSTPRVYVSNKVSYIQRFFSETDEYLIHLNNEKIKRITNNANNAMIVGTYTYVIKNKERLDNVLQWFKDKYGGNSEGYVAAKNKFKVGYTSSYTVGVIYLHDEISAVCSGILAEHPELDFIISVQMPTSMSYRSVKDLDLPLALISRDIGGGDSGGHEHAAGSPIPLGARTLVTKELIGNIRFN